MSTRNSSRRRLSLSTSLFALSSSLCLVALGCGDDMDLPVDELGDETDTGSADADDDIGSETDSSGETGTESESESESESGSDESESETETETDTEESDTEESPNQSCINGQFLNGDSPGPDYDEFDIIFGSHCNGTNHQDINDIERVVFLGDSITVGTPPTEAGDAYRSRVAEELSLLWGLDAPTLLWQQYDPFNGTAIIKEDGDFAVCAKWGARNDDFLTGGQQLEDCFPPQDRLARTLVITTMGGNDIAAMAKDQIEGVTEAALWDDAESMLTHMRSGMEWLVDPQRFPNGVFVVYANVFEYTDATVDLLACPAAGAAGFDSNPEDPELTVEYIRYINSEYMQVAEDTQTDMVFMAEGFCGHGFRADDTQSACYRGPDQDTWFDLSCIHPTPDGHEALANMFLDVILE